MTEKEIVESTSNVNNMRQDFSEGVIAQIPKNEIPVLIKDFQNQSNIIHDVRFRLNAYKYCNLLCFFRIDADEGQKGLLDEENISAMLRDVGQKVSPEEIRAMTNLTNIQKLVDSIVVPNRLLSPEKTHMIQLPSAEMNNFGDTVVVIKDENEFIRRVISAVEKADGHCIIGDVRYHNLVDRVDPTSMNRHHITIISSENDNGSSDKPWLTGNGTADISILNGVHDIIWMGCLDKYSIFASQREWRICWLPKERNYKEKRLQVEPLEDIIDIIPTTDIRRYLLQRYKGFIPGIIDTVRRTTAGTESYKEFKKRMIAIGGAGDFILEIG